MAVISDSLRDPATAHPCLRCGACCAHFRASFYWTEGDDQTPGGVPVAMTRQLSPHLRVMLGTEGSKPRCIALKGEIGRSAHCEIHPLRSSSCRDFPPAYEDGVTPNPRCDAARLRWGLVPLTPDDWRSPDQHPPKPIAA